MFYLNIILSWISENYYELIAAIAGILGVWLTAKQNILCWPVSLINVIFSVIVFFVAKLYAAVILQFFYFYITIYGWYKWHKGEENKAPLAVRKLKHKQRLFIPLFLLIGTSIVGVILDFYTDASLPYLDSFTTVGGIISTYMMARKIIEHWIVWIFLDTVSVSIYIYKGLYAFSLLYFIYCLMAIYGYFQWKKTIIN